MILKCLPFDDTCGGENYVINWRPQCCKMRKLRFTCDAKDCATKQKPAFLSISWKKVKYVVWWYCLEDTWVMTYNAINTYKRSGEGPCTHNGGEKETHSWGTKLLKQEHNNKNQCRKGFNQSCKWKPRKLWIYPLTHFSTLLLHV